MTRTRVEGEDGDIDMVPRGEENFHYTDCLDPTNLRVTDPETGTILRCLCHALVTYRDDETLRIWHRTLL